MDKIPHLKKLFANPALLDRALTHRSWINENNKASESNERLEFLGDAVLELVVSSALFDKFTSKNEGFLTSLRANIVNTTNLSRVANSLSIGEALKLSRGEEEGGGRKNKSLLADTLEAVIGALYLDKGIGACKKFIDIHLLADLDEIVKKPLKDAKSTLQELVQTQGKKAPVYKVLQETGPDHSKMFTLEVIVDGKVAGKGAGPSKAGAAQLAASDALKKLSSS